MYKQTHYHTLLIGTLLGIGTVSCAKPIITLFLQPYPLPPHELGATLEKPGKIAKAELFGMRNEHIAGIIGLYNGFFDVSNHYGQLTFPRIHEAPQLSIIVTRMIEPVLMMGMTVHHWELPNNSNAVSYRAERHYNKKADAYFWDIRQESLPEERRIPLDAIVILAKPKNIYIPQGISITDDTPNLFLPDIYVKKGVKTAQTALHLIHLTQFLDPVRFAYKKEEKVRLRHVAP